MASRPRRDGSARRLKVPGIGFVGEIRIARKDPGAVLPGPNGVFVQPAPYRCVADARNDAAVLRFAHDVGATETRQRRPAGGREFTGEGLRGTRFAQVIIPLRFENAADLGDSAIPGNSRAA